LNRSDELGPIEATQKDVPRGVTADQLLTGFWFGLSSTVDEETLDMIEEHRNLLRGRQTALNGRRRRYLEEELGRRLGVYADTSIDRMAQAVAARLMGPDWRSMGPTKRAQMRDALETETAREIAKGKKK
jgi:hypothetical protein